MNLKLKNVRLSYPELYEAKAFEGSEPAFSASFLLDKKTNAAEIAELQEAMITVAKGQWGNDNVKWHNGGIAVRVGGKAASAKGCLRDGSEKPDTDGYGPGVMFFSARNKLQPACVDKNPHVRLTKESGKPYAGCYVNVAIRLWAQDNNFGKRVNAQLQAVQFNADGESFGDAPIDPTTVFDNNAGDENPFTEGTGQVPPEEPDWIKNAPSNEPF